MFKIKSVRLAGVTERDYNGKQRCRYKDSIARVFECICWWNLKKKKTN
jgi:hypothetical protein